MRTRAGARSAVISSAVAPLAARWKGVTLRAVLFDLDGTLLDTVDAIAAALNLALAESLLAPLTVAQVREMIGRGAPLLIDVPIDRALR